MVFLYVARTDASVRKKYGGIGYVILRDNIPVDRFRKRVPKNTSVQLEVMALKELYLHIKGLGIKNIEIQTDLQAIITSIDKYKETKKCKNPIIKEVADYVEGNKDVTIKWIPREENKIADKLSREASSGKSKNLCKSKIKREQQHSKNETKMVIKYRKNILMRCIMCQENKSATEYPRKRIKGSRRACNTCQSNLRFIHRNT